MSSQSFEQLKAQFPKHNAVLEHAFTQEFDPDTSLHVVTELTLLLHAYSINERAAQQSPPVDLSALYRHYFTAENLEKYLTWVIAAREHGRLGEAGMDLSLTHTLAPVYLPMLVTADAERAECFRDTVLPTIFDEKCIPVAYKNLVYRSLFILDDRIKHTHSEKDTATYQAFLQDLIIAAIEASNSLIDSRVNLDVTTKTHILATITEMNFAQPIWDRLTDKTRNLGELLKQVTASDELKTFFAAQLKTIDVEAITTNTQAQQALPNTLTKGYLEECYTQAKDVIDAEIAAQTKGFTSFFKPRAQAPEIMNSLRTLLGNERSTAANQTVQASTLQHLHGCIERWNNGQSSTALPGAQEAINSLLIKLLQTDTLKQSLRK